MGWVSWIALFNDSDHTLRIYILSFSELVPMSFAASLWRNRPQHTNQSHM